MRGSLVNTATDFVVHEHAASAPQSSSSFSSTASAVKQSAACHPSHASPSFVLPSSAGGRLPLLYRPDARFARRTSASIGYACNAQQSGNMQLSLQWETAGELRRWEKERPYAVREERERQQRRARGEREEEKQAVDLFAAFPASVHPVPAAASFDLHVNHPLLPPALTSGSSVELDSRVRSNAARRARARRQLAEGALYDPYASSALPFFAPSASHYTALYTAPPSPSCCSRSSLKVQLTRHPAAAYTAAAGHRGRNNRWTEEQVFFRTGCEAAAAPGAAASVDLLFSSPLYSSFSLDSQYREPERTRRPRQQQSSRLQPPMMRRRQTAQQQRDTDGEDRERSAEEAEQHRLRAAEQQRQEAAGHAALQRAAVRLSGVFVPHVDTRRFLSSLSSRQAV